MECKMSQTLSKSFPPNVFCLLLLRAFLDTKDKRFRLILARGNILVWISLHGGARANLSSLVVRVHIEPTLVPINHILGSSHARALRGLRRYCNRQGCSYRQQVESADSQRMLILAGRRSWRNVSLAFWPRYCHTMPPQGSAMGGQVWPQWEAFCCCFPHPQQRGNMRASSVSIFRVSLTKTSNQAAHTVKLLLHLLASVLCSLGNLEMTPLSLPTTWPVC